MTRRLDVDNAELLLRPGMTATVSVVTREARTSSRCRVPRSATDRRWREEDRSWSLERTSRPANAAWTPTARNGPMGRAALRVAQRRPRTG